MCEPSESCGNSWGLCRHRGLVPPQDVLPRLYDLSKVHAAPSTASSKVKQLAILTPSPSSSLIEQLPAILLELPIPVVEGTDLAGFEPSRNAVEVEGVLRNR